MILMATNNFSAPTPTLTVGNYHIWAIKMKAYLKGLSLWEVIENDADPAALPPNPTLTQLKKHEEELANKPKTLTYIHAEVSNAVFISIMTCESPKEAWDKLKEDFEGNTQTKLMQILNLKKEFEIQKMKESESVKEYGSKLMTIVNQIKLLGEDFPTQRIVEKLLVSLPEKYESKISYLEDSKDLSKISFTELINALQAVDQRGTMRREANEWEDDVVYLAKELKGKGKISRCDHCKKLGHEEKDCWHKGKP